MDQTLFERWNRISLRTKITGVTVLMLTLGLLVSGIGTAAMLRSYAEQQLEQRLETIAQGKLTKYFVPGTKDDTSQPEVGTLALGKNDDVFIAIYTSDGNYQSNNWQDHPASDLPRIPQHLTQAQVLAQSTSSFTVFSLPDANGDPTFRAVTTLITADTQGTLAPIIIAVSSKATEQLMTAYLTIFLGFGLGVVIVGALLTRMLVTSTFTPLREVERTAAAIADGDFSQRLDAATPNTEVGRLNRSLNTMLNRIDRAFRDRARTIDQMRRFVGDASHELRTPLVSVRGYAELYRMGALQTPEEVAQAMDRIEKEAIRMGLLVEDLLALARLDEAKPLELAEVDLLPLARDAALDAMAASPDRIVTVTTPDEAAAAADPDATMSMPVADLDAVTGQRTTGPISFAGATLARLRARRPAVAPRRASTRAGGAIVTGVAGTQPALGPVVSVAAGSSTAPGRRAVVLAEENKIRQVITNLMGNAMRFTASDSPIEIRVSVDDPAERAVVEVIDHGEGIPPQIREKIFQRFWRADTSRTRETGGSGLGLAIVSSIVAAHNGQVEVVETPGGGATFQVSLPLASSPAAPRPIAEL